MSVDKHNTSDRVARLKSFEATLEKNARATQDSIKALLAIKNEHLFIEAGCKAFPEYCAKNEKRFGLKNIYQLLQFEEMNPEFTQLTGIPLRNKNVSRVLAPALAQVKDPEQAQKDLAKFAKDRGDDAAIPSGTNGED